MTRTDIAVQKFMEGYNCAQVVGYSFCDDLKLDQDLTLKLACGFGAGIARKEEVCGAVSGGVMVLGMKYGRGENQDRVLMEQTYRKTCQLIDKFVERYGTYICRELLDGIELTTQEGQKEFQEKEFKTRICAHCVRSVVEIIEDIIAKENGL